MSEKTFTVNADQLQALRAVQRLTGASLAVLNRDCKAARIFAVRNRVLGWAKQREEPLNLFLARQYFGLTFTVEGKRIALRG